MLQVSTFKYLNEFLSVKIHANFSMQSIRSFKTKHELVNLFWLFCLLMNNAWCEAHSAVMRVPQWPTHNGGLTLTPTHLNNAQNEPTPPPQVATKIRCVPFFPLPFHLSRIHIINSTVFKKGRFSARGIVMFWYNWYKSRLQINFLYILYIHVYLQCI